MSTPISDHIDAVESAYEYMLAYAAQGKETDRSNDGEAGEIRAILEQLTSACAAILDILSGLEYDFAEVVAGDIKKAQAALSLVCAQADISSELIDNLNASIHLRAVLTDLFLLDEIADF